MNPVRRLAVAVATVATVSLSLAFVPHRGAERSQLRPSGGDGTAIDVPFTVGERLDFQAKINFLKAGTATMEVKAIERVRGVPTFRTSLDIRGRVLMKRVENHYESWLDTLTLTSLRHIQETDDDRGEGKKIYDFYPERRVYVRNGEERPSVEQPLEEGSFLFFLRSIPLEVGKTYVFQRYYRADRNPVTVKVLRREKVTVPAGTFDAIVVQPTILSRGLFGEGSHAEVWIGTDAKRTILKLKSKLPVGTLYLELK